MKSAELDGMSDYKHTHLHLLLCINIFPERNMEYSLIICFIYSAPHICVKKG